MAFILLTLIGGLLGWLASIAVRIEDRDGILRLMATGLAASLVVGLLTNKGSVLGGLHMQALGFAVVAAVLALAGMIVFRRGQNQD